MARANEVEDSSDHRDPDHKAMMVYRSIGPGLRRTSRPDPLRGAERGGPTGPPLANLSHHPTDRVINDKHHHSTDNRDEHAVQVETGHTGRAETLKQPSPNDPADHPEDDVEEETFPLPVHDLAGDETGDQPEDDPAEDRHIRTPLSQLDVDVVPNAFLLYAVVLTRRQALRLRRGRGART